MSRIPRRLIPSPAMIVALLALVMSLGSSAYALGVITGDDIEDESVTGQDIEERSLRGHDLEQNSVGRLAVNESRLRAVHSAKGLQLWADVTDTGTVVRGRGGVAGKLPSAAHTPPGDYLVTFSRDVDRCSYQATIGGGGAVTVKESQITVSHPSNPKAVQVRTGFGTDSNGNSIAAPRPFQLAVNC